MPAFLVTMGPHRFVIEANDTAAASLELDRRLLALGLEREIALFHEQKSKEKAA